MNRQRMLIGALTVGLLLALLAGSNSLAIRPRAGSGEDDSGPSGEAGASAGLAAYGPWVVEVVDPALNVGSHVSIAISPHSGTTYISYYDASHDNLKMATYVGAGGNCDPAGKWSCETVDSGGDVGQYTSIAINPTIDLPAIAYYDATNEALKLAEWLGNSWYIRTIDDPNPGSVGTHTSLKIDSTGVPHIAYHAKERDLQPSRLFYATRAKGSTSHCTKGDFQCDPIDTAYAGYTSLDLNSHGNIGIAYQLNKRLKYARFVSPGGGNCGLGGSG